MFSIKEYIFGFNIFRFFKLLYKKYITKEFDDNVDNINDILQKSTNLFKINDKVIVTENWEDNNTKNKKGTILHILRNGFFAIRFDEKPLMGHNLNGKCINGYGWNVPSSIVKKQYKPSKHVKQLNWEDTNFYKSS